MIEWVYNHCSESIKLAGKTNLTFEISVVTDDERIEALVHSFSGSVVRVDDDVPSGTERNYLAWKRFYSQEKYDLIINVQGDEPLFRGEDLIELANYHLKSSFDIATMVKTQNDSVLFSDENLVKVIWSESSGQCHYFSRAEIPFGRESQVKDWYSHVGVYSFKSKALERFCEAPVGHYENIEKLEQLRALELGLSIGAIKTEKSFIGVDTPEDIEKLVGRLK